MLRNIWFMHLVTLLQSEKIPNPGTRPKPRISDKDRGPVLVYDMFLIVN